jgi:hypothetical protein
MFEGMNRNTELMIKTKRGVLCMRIKRAEEAYKHTEKRREREKHGTVEGNVWDKRKEERACISTGTSNLGVLVGS